MKLTFVLTSAWCYLYVYLFMTIITGGTVSEIIDVLKYATILLLMFVHKFQLQYVPDITLRLPRLPIKEKVDYTFPSSKYDRYGYYLSLVCDASAGLGLDIVEHFALYGFNISLETSPKKEIVAVYLIIDNDLITCYNNKWVDDIPDIQQEFESICEELIQDNNDRIKLNMSTIKKERVTKINTWRGEHLGVKKNENGSK